MNVRTLCLSILYEGESTGYEIRQLCVEGECSYFVEASFGSIYPALSKLEQEKLVISRIEQQVGKPAKKVYSITDAGRAAFVDELAAPLGDDMLRSPFLLFARFVHILPRDLVETRANEFLTKLINERSKMEDALVGRTSTAGDTWVLNYGRAMMELAERHMRSHMHELITLAQAEPTKNAAE